MKYLLMIITALGFVGAATATPSSDCCTGGACCMGPNGLLHKVMGRAVQ